MANWLLRLFTVLFQAIGDLVLGIVSGFVGGLVNLAIRFFSSQFGIGISIFMFAAWLHANGREDTAVWLGLAGAVIAFTSFRGNRRRR